MCRLAAPESVGVTVSFVIVTAVGTVAIPTVLIAIPPAQAPTLVKTSVSVFFVASKTSPVVAVMEAVVEARRNFVAARVGLSVPVSGYTRVAAVVLRPVAVNPGVARARAWRNVGCIRRRRLVETAAASSEAYAD